MGLLRFQFDHYDQETIDAMIVIFGEDDVNDLLYGEDRDKKFELELELRRK